MNTFLDGQQRKDQTGFKSRVVIEIFEYVFYNILYNCVCGKSLEWNAPVWFANLELTTALAFDRVE